MNRLCLVFLFHSAMTFGADFSEASLYQSFRFGGYAYVTNRMDCSLLDNFPPLDAFSKTPFSWQRFLNRVEGIRNEEPLKRQLSFWQSRVIQRVFVVEKSFWDNDYSVFTEHAEKMGADFGLVMKDPSHEAILSGTLPVVIESLQRMLESNLPQRKWISQDFLHEIFAPLSLNMCELKQVKWQTSYMILVSAAIAVLEYKDKTGVLPHALADLYENIPVDAWGHPIVYLQQNQRWLLKSLSDDGTDDGYDFENNVPLIPGKRDLVLFDGMSQVRKRLLTDGQLQMSRIKVTLFKGGLRVDDFLSAPK